VGLGNPGERYRWTRHNVGFMVVDALAGGSDASVETPGAWRLVARLGGRLVTLVKPLTFMNRSGPAVAALLQEAGAGPGDLIAIVDDAALDPGRIRIRAAGGHGGHNGLRSLIEALGSEDFPRVRVGVGAAEDLAEHVLSPIPERDMLAFRRSVERAAGAVVAVLEDGVEAAMSRFNAWPLPDAVAEDATKTPRS
jgi:PTH1 family peptidyl-tRNA hydrolase